MNTDPTWYPYAEGPVWWPVFAELASWWHRRWLLRVGVEAPYDALIQRTASHAAGPRAAELANVLLAANYHG